MPNLENLKKMILEEEIRADMYARYGLTTKSTPAPVKDDEGDLTISNDTLPECHDGDATACAPASQGQDPACRQRRQRRQRQTPAADGHSGQKPSRAPSSATSAADKTDAG